MPAPIRVCCCLTLYLSLLGSPLQAAVLYDGSLGTLPSSQGWLYLTDPLFGAGSTRWMDAGAAALDTTPAMSDSAGYFSTFHPAMPILDRQQGVQVRFRVQIDEESHGSQDRAGFSLIALTDDVLGIELGFWEDLVWAQSGPGFTHAEETPLDTTSHLRQYDLNLFGSGYSLWADGQPILAGPLRDYSSHPHPVYSLSNFLFVGDDTSSASAIFRLAAIEVLTGIAVPEPSTVGLAILAIAVLWARRGRYASRLNSSA